MSGTFDNTMPLQFATHDEIVAELKRRYSSILLVVEQKDVGDGEIENITDFGGGKVSALGLAELAKARIFASLTKTVEIVPEPDDEEDD